MENNKIILSYCKNFDRIINTDFIEGDNLSIQLVKIYKDFIFKIDINNADDIKDAEDIDYIMGKYVEDYNFRKTLQEKMHTIKIKKSVNMLQEIVRSIIQIFKKYELEATRKIYISKWI